ncbi:hypothetical protein AGMMS49525_00710 [Bacteroidia bacterium]|nr:hypothetical protein AGMMS49525_00710 [Bacteroidia bacterium]
MRRRLTAADAHDVTIPSALASASANGLMSAAQYNLLNGSQTAKTFLAAPNASAGTPSYRAIDAGYVPTLNQNTTGSAGSLTSAGTITVSGTATATATTAGAMPAGAYAVYESSMHSINAGSPSNAACALKFGAGATSAAGKLCTYTYTTMYTTFHAAQADSIVRGIRLPAVHDLEGIGEINHYVGLHIGTSSQRMWSSTIERKH